MKHLTLMRHAKSSWGNPNLQDFDRPLNKRGQGDAPLMARALVERDIQPDCFYISPARRTMETAIPLLESLDEEAMDIDYREEIYEPSALQLLALVRQTPDQYDDLLLLGHNPGMSDLGFILSGEEPMGLSTGAIHRIALHVESWEDLAKNCGDSQWHIWPKMFK